jgi:hypothetical protein
MSIPGLMAASATRTLNAAACSSLKVLIDASKSLLELQQRQDTLARCEQCQCIRRRDDRPAAWLTCRTTLRGRAPAG